jgi:YVTN family beta-propeller protein
MIRAAVLLAAITFIAAQPPATESPKRFWVCVSNERSGDITIIDGTTLKPVGTIAAGKRPRGIHASPDGKQLFVALSGSPIHGPPALDAKGNPIFPDEDPTIGDRNADGIGVIDLKEKKLIRRFTATGSDPEEFAISRDGKRLYISNEDAATASVLNIADGKLEHIIKVKKEPEGVAVSPDGKFVYVTCETNGEIFVIESTTNKTVAEIPVGGRPRTVAFLPDGSKAFIPSESAGTISVVDTQSNKVTKLVKLPEGSRPMGTAMSPDGKRLMVSNGRAGTISILDSAEGRVLQTVAVGKRPWGVGLSPDGRFAFTANGPSDDISVVDVAAGKEVTRIKAGHSPWGIAVVAAPE